MIICIKCTCLRLWARIEVFQHAMFLHLYIVCIQDMDHIKVCICACFFQLWNMNTINICTENAAKIRKGRYMQRITANSTNISDIILWIYSSLTFPFLHSSAAARDSATLAIFDFPPHKIPTRFSRHSNYWVRSRRHRLRVNERRVARYLGVENPPGFRADNATRNNSPATISQSTIYARTEAKYSKIEVPYFG